VINNSIVSNTDILPPGREEAGKNGVTLSTAHISPNVIYRAGARILKTSKNSFDEINFESIDMCKCLENLNANLSIDSNLDFREVDPIKSL